MTILKAGSTSQSVYFDILDNQSTTGGRKTGLVFNSPLMTAYYVRHQSSGTSISLQTLTNPYSAWSAGGFKEVDATNMPGIYRLDLPDAAIATGTPSVVVYIKGASGMVASSCRIDLIDVDLRDSVRAGLTSLPAAAAGATNGLPLSTNASGQVAVSTNNDKTGYSLSSPQSFNLIGNVSGTWVGNQTGTFLGNRIGNISGSVGALQVNNDKTGYSLLNNQVINFSGTITNVLNVTNPVTVGTNNDKSGYSLSSPQTFNLIGNVSGTWVGNQTGTFLGNRIGNISGSVGAVQVVNDKVNYQLLNNQVVNFSGTITNVYNVLNPVTAGNVTGSVFGKVNGSVNSVQSGFVSVTGTVVSSVVQGGTVTVSGTVTATVASVPIVGMVTGSVGSVIGLNTAYIDTYISSRMASGTVVVGTNNDKTNYQLANNQVINISGTITNVMNVINPVVAGTVTGTVTVAGLNTSLLDVAVSSRMASGTVVVGTNNDKTGYGLNTGTFIQSVVNGVWDEQIASHLGVGTTGKSLNSASSAGDPWNTSLPGVYGAGTAGSILGNNLDAKITTRLATGTFLSNLPPTAAQIATETLNEASANPIASNIKKVNDVTLKGDGNATPWGPV